MSESGDTNKDTQHVKTGGKEVDEPKTKVVTSPQLMESRRWYWNQRMILIPYFRYAPYRVHRTSKFFSADGSS